MICVCSDTEGFVLIDSVCWMKSSASACREIAKKFVFVARRGYSDRRGYSSCLDKKTKKKKKSQSACFTCVVAKNKHINITSRRPRRTITERCYYALKTTRENNESLSVSVPFEDDDDDDE